MYFELDETVRDNPEFSMLKTELHKFARDVMRPVARELDQMKPEEVSAPESPYFRVMKQMKQNGYHRILVAEEFGGELVGPEAYNIFFEELGWGSMGLATALGVDLLPSAVMSLVGSPEVIDEVLRPWMDDTENNYRGCWSVMDPDRGSDYITAMAAPDPEELGTRGFCRAERDGDGWVINGVKSYWTSSAPCANWALTHPLVPPHENPLDLGAAVIPLTLPGVTVAAGIDKLGTRDVPQGEIVFENVRIPGHYMLAAVPEMTTYMVKMILSCTSCAIASMSIGLARAAFEEALRYTHERIQGGRPIVEHQLTRHRLYLMSQKLETARYFTRAVTKNVYDEIFVKRTFLQSTPHALMAQAYAKQSAFEIASEALQLFGGSGIMKETLVERLFRDARCVMIEDGTVEILGLASIDEALNEGTYTWD